MILAALQVAAAEAALVVVAPVEWHGALAPFVAARRAELPVELAALEDVVAAAPGADPPERLKRWLHDAWASRGARYVLLVGDADVCPVRFMVLDRCTEAALHTAFYPSDLYYADVAEADGTFDDWNHARDGHHARYFGEVRGECTKDAPIDFDRVSYVPELAVGRWPVSTADELAAVIAKTLARERRAGGPALFVHADGWIDARARVGACAAPLGARGYEVELQLYGADSAAVAAPTHASVVAGLLRAPAFVGHLGHGDVHGWDRCLGPGDLGALAAIRPTVFLSVGCSTAHFVCEPPYQAYLDEGGVPRRGTNDGEVFTSPPPAPHWLQPGRYDHAGLGERLVLMPAGGAVAYIGCTTGAQPCAVTLLEAFCEALTPEARVGDAWRAALAAYVERERLHALVPDEGWYPPSIFFQGMKFVLLGDPTTHLD